MSAFLLEREMVHYEVLGRGRPILFLHSWVGSWRYWIPVMQAASVSFRTYAIDLWGFGDSSKNPVHYSLAEQIRLLDGFLEQLGIMRFVVVGHGLGAVLGLMYARKNPGVVDRVMAVGLPLDETMIHPRLRSDSPAVLADWLLGRLPATEAVRSEAPKADVAAIQTSLNALSGAGLGDMWRSTQISCLLVNGLNDPVVQPPRLDQLPDMPELMHAIAFEQSGHFPMLDETSKFNRLLIDFLGLASGESPRDLQLKEEWKRRVR
jgi:pimeloyl-ACP methyl ester carboxylesterase